MTRYCGGGFYRKMSPVLVYGAIVYYIDRGFGFDIKSVQEMGKDACVFKEKYYDKFINPIP